MSKTVPIFLLLFAEYLCNHTYATTTVGTQLLSTISETTGASPSVPAVQKIPPSVHRVMVTSSHALTFPQDSETEQPPTTKRLPERDLAAELVAGISISMLSLLILIMIGVWCLRKKSKRNSAEITSDPSGKP